jgi:hypothetical protein
VAGEPTREVMLDPEASTGTPSETKGQAELPGPNAGHPLYSAGISHSFSQTDGRYRTTASIPDTRQDADLQFWTAEQWPDTFH